MDLDESGIQEIWCMLSEKELNELNTIDNYVEQEPKTVPKSGRSVYDQSLDLIKESMANVIQEIIIDLDGKSYLVYLTRINIDPSGKVEFDFNTFNQEDIEMLRPHVEKCLLQQIKSIKIPLLERIKLFFRKFYD